MARADEDPIVRIRANAMNLDGYLRSISDHIKSQSNPLNGKMATNEDHIARLYDLGFKVAHILVRSMNDTAAALDALRKDR